MGTTNTRRDMSQRLGSVPELRTDTVLVPGTGTVPIPGMGTVPGRRTVPGLGMGMRFLMT